MSQPLQASQSPSVPWVAFTAIMSSIRKISCFHKTPPSQKYAVREQLAPADNIPPEILGIIFANLVPKTLSIPSKEVGAIWNVAQTCSSWRAVALGLHHIWSDLTISLSRQHEEIVPAFASECLRRSGQSPLLVTFTNLGRYDSFTPFFLIPYTSRIQYLNAHPLSMISVLQPVLPNLQHLEAHLVDCLGDMGWGALLTRSGCKLTRLTLSGFSPFWERVLKQIASLEELCFRAPISSDAIEQLSKKDICPSLRLIECIVTENILDPFIKMLESRPTIVDVTVQLIKYDKHMRKVHFLEDRGVRVEVQDTSDWLISLALDDVPETSWGLEQYDSDSDTDGSFT